MADAVERHERLSRPDAGRGERLLDGGPGDGRIFDVDRVVVPGVLTPAGGWPVGERNAGNVHQRVVVTCGQTSAALLPRLQVDQLRSTDRCAQVGEARVESAFTKTVRPGVSVRLDSPARR